MFGVLLPWRVEGQEKPEKPPIEVGGPPLITDDPDTPGQGQWEINVALTETSHPDEKEFELPLIDANYGLLDPIELTFELPLQFRHIEGDTHQQRVGDPEIGVKWRFVKHGRFAMSIYPHATFDNASDRFLQSFGHPAEVLLPVEAQFKVLLFKFDGEFGRSLVRTQDGPDEWQWGLATRHKMSDSFKLLGEIHGNGTSLRHPDGLVFNVGATWEPREHLPIVLASIGRSLPGKRPDRPSLLAFAGLQFNW